MTESPRALQQVDSLVSALMEALSYRDRSPSNSFGQECTRKLCVL